jgi:hypothetical protein
MGAHGTSLKKSLNGGSRAWAGADRGARAAAQAGGRAHLLGCLPRRARRHHGAVRDGVRCEGGLCSTTPVRPFSDPIISVGVLRMGENGARPEDGPPSQRPRRRVTPRCGWSRGGSGPCCGWTARLAVGAAAIFMPPWFVLHGEPLEWSTGLLQDSNQGAHAVDCAARGQARWGRTRAWGRTSRGCGR